MPHNKKTVYTALALVQPENQGLMPVRDQMLDVFSSAPKTSTIVLDCGKLVDATKCLASLLSVDVQTVKDATAWFFLDYRAGRNNEGFFTHGPGKSAFTFGGFPEDDNYKPSVIRNIDITFDGVQLWLGSELMMEKIKPDLAPHATDFRALALKMARETKKVVEKHKVYRLQRRINKKRRVQCHTAVKTRIVARSNGVINQQQAWALAAGASKKLWTAMIPNRFKTATAAAKFATGKANPKPYREASSMATIAMAFLEQVATDKMAQRPNDDQNEILEQTADHFKENGTFWDTDANFQPVTDEQQTFKLFNEEYNVVGCVAPVVDAEGGDEDDEGDVGDDALAEALEEEVLAEDVEELDGYGELADSEAGSDTE